MPEARTDAAGVLWPAASAAAGQAPLQLGAAGPAERGVTEETPPGGHAARLGAHQPPVQQPATGAEFEAGVGPGLLVQEPVDAVRRHQVLAVAGGQAEGLGPSRSCRRCDAPESLRCPCRRGRHSCRRGPAAAAAADASAVGALGVRSIDACRDGTDQGRPPIPFSDRGVERGWCVAGAVPGCVRAADCGRWPAPCRGSTSVSSVCPAARTHRRRVWPAAAAASSSSSVRVCASAATPMHRTAGTRVRTATPGGPARPRGGGAGAVWAGTAHFSSQGPDGPCAWCGRSVALNGDRGGAGGAGCSGPGCAVRRETFTPPTNRLWTAAGYSCPPPAPAPGNAARPAPAPAPPRGPVAGSAAPLLPFTRRQLTLFGPRPRRLAVSDGVPADPVLAAWLEHHLSAWAMSGGWSRSTLTRYRRGLRIMLAVQDTPGGPVPAGMVQELSGTGLAARLLHDFLAAHGFLKDDSPQTVDLWFTRTTAHLSEPMAGRLAHWFTVRLHGRTTVPRSLARSPITVRNHLRFALPVFTRLAAAGLSDLTDIPPAPPARLRQELAACELTGSDYTHTASALRTVFAFPAHPPTRHAQPGRTPHRRYPSPHRPPARRHRIPPRSPHLTRPRPGRHHRTPRLPRPPRRRNPHPHPHRPARTSTKAACICPDAASCSPNPFENA